MTPEISTRLTEEVKTRAPSLFDKLQPALDLANRQLEWLCPAVMATTRNGLIAELAATAQLGTWLIVLANERKLFTMHFIVPPDAPFTRRQVVDDCCAAAIEILGHVPTAEEIIHVIDLVVEQHGGQPQEKTPQLDQALAQQILGALFAPMPDRNEVIDIVDRMIAENVCPLHVGLIGKGSKKGTKCGLWPIGLPFATYLEHINNLMDA